MLELGAGQRPALRPALADLPSCGHRNGVDLFGGVERMLRVDHSFLSLFATLSLVRFIYVCSYLAKLMQPKIRGTGGQLRMGT